MPAKNTEQEKKLNKATGKNTRKKTTAKSTAGTKKTVRKTATKTTKGKTTPQKAPNLNLSPAEHEENIRTSAYFRWEQRGEIHGFDVEDWLHAEKTVNS